MTDNPYEKFEFGEPGENQTELLGDSLMDAAEPAPNNDLNTPEPAAPVPEPAAVEPVKTPDTPTYGDAFDTDSGYDRTVEPKAEPRPFVNPYTQEKTTQDMNSGYYHYSYQPNPNRVSQPAAGQQNAYSAPKQETASNPYSTRITSDSAPKEKKEKRGLSGAGIAILLVVCILISGAAGFGGSVLASKLKNPTVEQKDGSSMVVYKVDPESKAYSDEDKVDKTTTEITEEVADTVVEITTESMQTSSFYGQYISQGAGSGVIISDDGYILTNNHVISGATSIKVTTRSGENYDAKLIGTDAKVDIALLKIEATDLPKAVFGDSSKLEVGSKAVIIGNPLGTLGGSVTEGIISALDRSIEIDGKTMHLMQTDAAINPGNSGGGMFDGQGYLSGIVVAKSSSEEIDNIGFVIPINNVIEILGDLKDYGYVRGRADTGMTFIDLTNSMYAWYYYGTGEAGVYVNSVENGSGAATAGFRKGDRVVSVDGEKISSSDDITTVINEKSAGDKVSFVINRGGSNLTLELTLDEDVPDDIDGGSSNNKSSDQTPNGGTPYDPYGRSPW